MKLKFSLYLKRPEKIFKIDKNFKTKSEVTNRTVEVAEAFGLGIDEEREFTVYKEFSIDVNQGDIVYITGDSGGGKSLLLKELALQMKCGGFGEVYDSSKIMIDEDEVLVEGVGESTSEAVEILSQAGLNEAFLMLRRYRELSDGQKYRYRLAKAIESKADLWIFDEFCSLLDRDTARVVAYCIQKAARRLNKTVLLATAHHDLIYDVNPDLIVNKGFGCDVKVERLCIKPRACSILDEVQIHSASIDEFHRSNLEQFHYRGYGLGGFPKHIFLAYFRQEAVGAIIYVTPYIHLKGRSIALPQYNGRSEYLSTLNRDFIRISRVIVHPKFRSIGLGVKLVKETMPLVNTLYVETLAVMAKYNPFFEKAGMIRINIPEDKRDKAYSNALVRLEGLGFNLNLLSSKSFNLKIIKGLNIEERRIVANIILHYMLAKRYRSNTTLEHKVRSLEPEALGEGLKYHRLPCIYLIWRNPSFKSHPDVAN